MIESTKGKLLLSGIITIIIELLVFLFGLFFIPVFCLQNEAYCPSLNYPAGLAFVILSVVPVYLLTLFVLYLINKYRK